ncbi:Uncharacterised protein [Mycobacterium tuberculosis]|nr:Uncharacterised protein [Mycobacterium tuberculosis]CKU00229.1 Uncharacterised protein [Mycobacterium tuberculosis]COW45558.1 Uncharacterised protein [Mycobacterium tuberculosis]
MTLVDDAHALRRTGAELGEGRGDLADQLVADGGIRQHIVGCNACLPGVEQFDPGDPLGRDIYIGIGRDDHRALAAELEGDRGQVRRGAFVDLAADLGATGEHHAVETLSDQLLTHRTIALHDRDRFGVEIAIHQFGHQVRRCSGDFRRFEHDGVSSGNGSDRRTQGQVERVVPGTDD